MRFRDIERVLYQIVVNVTVWIVSQVMPPKNFNWYFHPLSREYRRQMRSYNFRVMAFIPMIIAITPLLMIFSHFDSDKG